MKSFIDQHRERFGVEPICKMLRVARPRTGFMRRGNATPRFAAPGPDVMNI